MNGELLAALERLEREKGIKKEILFEAIESALISAAIKILGEGNVAKEDISVSMDKETGNIKVFKGDKEFKSAQFGRIAAQTAKQVMIQKIREAERDVISEKYLDMEGTIISGAVHRFEKGNIIVELKDTEAVLPKSEQNQRERFRQGEIIRALLLKVERKTSGVEIILSRASADFVKKLFELEVPEIAQGIVEIKAISREAGERTKVAVFTNDDKIDSVGACVGMRGSRVKEIVKELSGERVDIVRWSQDIREYVEGAVNPAEIYNMEIDRDKKEIRLVVPKDQLAILIGKRGRNIRLASKLVGWEIKADVIEEAKDIGIKEVPNIETIIAEKLDESGCSNVSKVFELGKEGLAKIDGISPEMADRIIEACENAIEIVNNTQSGENKDNDKTKKDNDKSSDSGILGDEVVKKQDSGDKDDDAPAKGKGED